MTTIRYRVAWYAQLPGLPMRETVAGIDEGLAAFSPYRIRWVERSSGPVDVLFVVARVPPIRGRVARGYYFDESNYRHFGVPHPGCYANATDTRRWTRNVVKKVVMHEYGHALWGPAHSTDRRCVMHSYGTSDRWCAGEDARLARRFGRSGPPPKPDPPKPKPNYHNAANPLDVNEDGKIDVGDVELLDLWAHHMIAARKGFDLPATPYAPGKPDVNGDGKFTYADMVAVTRAALRETARVANELIETSHSEGGFCGCDGAMSELRSVPGPRKPRKRK